MTQTANNYGTVLFELGVGKETVEEMKRIFSLTGVLPRVLDWQGKAPADRAAVSKGGLEFLKRNVRPRKRIGDGRRLQSVYALL